jgi:hypothetical protein
MFVNEGEVLPMMKMLSQSLAIAGMLSTPAMLTQSELPTATTEYKNDPRLASLRNFFQAGECPAQDFSEEFLRAADHHKLDWRLLPSISLVESGGGREARNNNLFGWDSGRAVFSSVRAGIYNVAGNLAHSRIYRDKDTDEILRLYNPNENYPGVVKSVMRRISPSEKL